MNVLMNSLINWMYAVSFGSSMKENYLHTTVDVFYMNFFEYTYNLVRQIPDGKISTYGAVARALGDIRASRAVGRMMNQNPDADDMPCFKIVYSDGKLGGFGLGIDDKIRRLKQDDISVKDGRIVDFKGVLFDDFKTDYPLKKLRMEQMELSKKMEIADDFDEIETVAGFDVGYPKSDFDDCCGACVVMDYTTKEVIEEKTVFAKTFFPYIPTYLSFRELPFLKKLVANLKSKPTILMIDGNGVMHPYGFGIASHVGVSFDTPSIGVAKSMLCGKLENNVVKMGNKKIGYALFSYKRVRKPIYVSPGHKISFGTSLEVVRHLSVYKNPEPLRRAHILATTSI
jgi:deoxyribonuclease V